MLGTTGTFVGTHASFERVKSNHPLHLVATRLRVSTASKARSTCPRQSCRAFYDSSLADENLEIATEDAHAMARRLAREQGLLVGVSAAAAVVGCLRVVDSLKIKSTRHHRDYSRRHLARNI